ncbi:MAG: phytoene desaturase family protein [Promethearchaeota archaeon]
MRSSSDYDPDRVVSTHDVVVVGAGLGGLGAACQLALDGVSDVLLLEKHNVPGGFATSFVRGRYEFEGALHEMSSLGTEETPGSLYPFFEELGILEKVQFVKVAEIYRSVFTDGYDVTMPFGFDTFFEKLEGEFPAEAKKIRDFKKVCLKIKAGMDYMSEKGGKVSPLSILLKHPWLARVSGLTLEDLLRKFDFSPRLVAVLAQLWGYVGLPPSRLNAVIFVGMYLSYLYKGAMYPRGRSHAMTSALLEAFRERGGQVRFNALVDRILVDGGGRAHGVELLNGDVYRCRAVISNANPICTTMKMLPPGAVSPEYKRKIMAPKLGPSAFSVYLGVNAPPEKLGLEVHETFVNSTYDIEEAAAAMSTLEPPKCIVAASYNAVDPDACPPGTTQLVLTALQFGRAWHTIAPDQYFRKKDEIADAMIGLVERTVAPGLREHMEVASIATPLTYYRYAKTYDGAIYGYEQDVLDGPVFRLKSGESPIKNLFWGSAWVNDGGGFGPSLGSGRAAARLAMKYLEGADR